jgi:N-acetylmuramic acid 6-phosphate (MurNAc-6-P) etherase
MIALGRAYRPRMVDVRVTNAKLRRRAVRIVRDAAGVDEETATALAAAGDHAKTAIVALLAGVDAAEAAVRLDRRGDGCGPRSLGPAGRALGEWLRRSSSFVCLCRCRR